MKKIFTFSSILAFVISCSPSEKDFVGEYATLYSAKVTDASELDLFASMYSRKTKSSVKVYSDLCDIKLTLFVDESTKQLKGELRMTEMAESGMFGISTTAETVDFDVINFRIINDTLHFSIDNQILRLKEKKVSGRLVKNGDEVVLGFEESLTGWTDEANTNPLFVSKHKDFIFHKALSGTVTRDSVVRQHYRAQIKEMGDKVGKLQDEREKMIMKNSIDALKKKLAR